MVRMWRGASSEVVRCRLSVSADVSLSEVSAPLIVSSSIGMSTLAQTRTAQAPMYKHESTALLLRRTGVGAIDYPSKSRREFDFGDEHGSPSGS